MTTSGHSFIDNINIKHEAILCIDDIDIGHDTIVCADTEQSFGADIDRFFIQPLISGSAYYIDIKSFKLLNEIESCYTYDVSGLSPEVINGYSNEHNIVFRPYIIEFEFRYEQTFLQNLKAIFDHMSNEKISSSFNVSDLRSFNMPCIVFGDFDLEYIEKEGWYGINNFYVDEAYSLNLEPAKLISKRLHRMQCNLYFSFVDSNDHHVVGVYSDFHDNYFSMYNTALHRKIGRIMVNTTRSTFSAYQVEPLSPMAMSYKLRTFFLVRQHDYENLYSFIIFLNDDEIDQIKNIKAWANVD